MYWNLLEYYWNNFKLLEYIEKYYKLKLFLKFAVLKDTFISYFCGFQARNNSFYTFTSKYGSKSKNFWN